MTPIRGWSERGRKLIGRAPFGKWSTLTSVAALRGDRIDAPCVLDGPINGQSFTAWVEQFLVPTLAPGDVVIMDNLGSPIQQVFAKLKLMLRRAAERTTEDTWRRIGSLLDRFPPDECAVYIRNSGYASSKRSRL